MVFWVSCYQNEAYCLNAFCDILFIDGRTNTKYGIAGGGGGVLIQDEERKYLYKKTVSISS